MSVQQPPTPPPAPTTATEESKPEQQKEQRDLAPGGYPCQACGLTFRTPEELEEHKSKNSGKEGTEHIQ